MVNALVNSRLDYYSLFSEVCPVLTNTNCSVFKTHLVGLSLIAIYTHELLLFFKKLHWLPVEFRCIFKTAILVYKFLHSGHPSYSSPHLSICCGRCGTRYNYPDKRFLEVPQYYPSVHKPKKHFSHSFALDAPILCLFQEKDKILHL